MPFLKDNHRNPDNGSHSHFWERGHGGQLFEIRNAHLAASIVRDILFMKDAVDVGVWPGNLFMASRDGPPISQWSAEGLAEVAALPFEQLVEHLQACLTKIKPKPLDSGPYTAAAELLRAAAFGGHTALMRLLLVLVSPMSHLEEMPAVFEEACEVYQSMGDASSKLRLGWSALHTAAAGGSIACASMLLQAEPRLATVATQAAWLPTHVAAWHGHADVLQLLLDAAPATAAATNGNGHLPFHAAALGGWERCVRLLLAVEPAAVGALNRLGQTALHLASRCQRPRDANGSSHAAVVQLLMQLRPAAVSLADAAGRLPLGSCAGCEHGSAEVFNMLLRANPAALNARDAAGYLPVHLAAGAGNIAVLRILHDLSPDSFYDTQTANRFSPMHFAAHFGQPEAVSFLLEAAPISVAIVDSRGLPPLSTALAKLARRQAEQSAATTRRHAAVHQRLLDTARRLLPAVPAATALSGLAGAGHIVQLQLFSDAVTCHLPLSPAEWLLVPSGCPNLIHALPAALRHSQEQAAQLVRRLPQADKARLRTAVMSMARVQRLSHATLPPVLMDSILAQAFGG